MVAATKLVRSRSALISCVLVLVSALATGSTQATLLDVTNPGFEDTTGGSPFNEFTFGAFAGWNVYDPDTITGGGNGPDYFVGTLTPQEESPGVYVFFPDGAPAGQRVGIAFAFADSAGVGSEYGLIQTLSDTLAANMVYTLQVEIGNIASGTAVNEQFFNLDGFPGYRVDLLAGGVVIAQDNNSLAGTIPEVEFLTSTVVYQSGANPAQLGQPLAIRLVNLNTVDGDFPAADLEVDFDNVSLDATATIPEPAILVLTLLGIAVLRVRRN